MASGLGVPQFNTPIDPVQTITTVVSPAQILAMNGNTNTSVHILPAPAANQSYELLAYSINFEFPVSGGVAYATGTKQLLLGVDNGGVLNGVWAGFPGGLLTSANLLAAVSSYNTCNHPNIVGSLAVSSLVGKGLDLNIATGGANYTAGNSGITITVRYRIVNLV